jgi:hypothetical protein
MLFQEMLDQIKGEARIKQDDTLDEIVFGIINQQFKEAVQNNRPWELRKAEKIPLTTGNSLFNLPQDFYLWHEILFNDADTGRVWGLVDQDGAAQPAPIGMYGHPKSFEIIENNQIFVNPSSSIVTGDFINLVYYKIPPIVTEEILTQENPIPRLEPFIIAASIRRVRMFHDDDMAVAQMLTGDIQQAAQGYTKDLPEEKE